MSAAPLRATASISAKLLSASRDLSMHSSSCSVRQTPAAAQSEAASRWLQTQPASCQSHRHATGKVQHDIVE